MQENSDRFYQKLEDADNDFYEKMFGDEADSEDTAPEVSDENPTVSEATASVNDKTAAYEYFARLSQKKRALSSPSAAQLLSRPSVTSGKSSDKADALLRRKAAGYRRVHLILLNLLLLPVAFFITAFFCGKKYSDARVFLPQSDAFESSESVTSHIDYDGIIRSLLPKKYKNKDFNVGLVLFSFCAVLVILCIFSFPFVRLLNGGRSLVDFSFKTLRNLILAFLFTLWCALEMFTAEETLLCASVTAFFLVIAVYLFFNIFFYLAHASEKAQKPENQDVYV